MDLGGTKLLTALLDKQFEIIAFEKEKMEIAKGANYFLELVSRSVHELLKQAKIGRASLTAAGIGCAGVINEKGTVVASPNLPFLEQFPMRKKLRHIFPGALANHLLVIAKPFEEKMVYIIEVASGNGFSFFVTIQRRD